MCKILFGWSLWIPSALLFSSFCLVLLPSSSQQFAQGFGAPFLLAPRSRSSSKLHGVRGFWTWYEKEFPQTISHFKKPQYYDHVLIDGNQLLHSVVRAGVSNSRRCMKRFMSDLNLIANTCVPRKSLVIVMDGASSAAKISPKRRFRNRSLHKVAWRLQHLDHLAVSDVKKSKIRRKVETEVVSFCLTPGTEFSELVESTLKYWAWQYMSNIYNQHNVTVYLSPSSASGEGEVKLMDWLINYPQPDESAAVIGRDSDMILAGLLVPTTDNIYIIDQWFRRGFRSVDLKNTIQHFTTWLPPNPSKDQLDQLRTDLMVLATLQGNDYIPRLARSVPFHRSFQAYQEVLSKHYTAQNDCGVVGLVDPETLNFNLDFCIDLFEVLSKGEEDDFSSSSNSPDTLFTGNYSAMETLKIMGATGFANEITFQKTEPTMADSDSSSPDCNQSEMVLEVKVGDDIKTYSKPIPDHASSRQVMHQLSELALKDMVARGIDVHGYSFAGYGWEIECAAKASVEKYLAAVLWVLQTFQDGICPDYSFDYGRRRSPSASKIVKFLKLAKEQGRVVGRHNLLNSKFGPPFDAGLCCFAALPSQMKVLLPEPYRSIPEEKAEEIYEKSLDPADNSLKLGISEKLCKAEFAKLVGAAGETDKKEKQQKTTGWMVFEQKKHRNEDSPLPPPPPTAEFRFLRPNDKLSISYRKGTIVPPQRPVWVQKGCTTDPSQVDEWTQNGGNNLSSFVPKRSDGGTEDEEKMFIPDQSRCSDKEKEDIVMTDPFKTQSLPKVQAPLPSPRCNADGQSALVVLKQLHDLQIIGPYSYNITYPSRSQQSRFPPLYEGIQLCIEKSTEALSVLNDTWTYSMNRNILSQSKQNVKSHLADVALCDIIGDNDIWVRVSFNDLRDYLAKRKEHTASVKMPLNTTSDGITAISCLKELADVGLIISDESMNIPTSNNDTEEETITMVVIRGPSLVGTMLQEPILVNHHRSPSVSKQEARQMLASQVLTQLTGEHCNWTELSGAEIKSLLVSSGG